MRKNPNRSPVTHLSFIASLVVAGSLLLSCGEKPEEEAPPESAPAEEAKPEAPAAKPAAPQEKPAEAKPAPAEEAKPKEKKNASAGAVEPAPSDVTLSAEEDPKKKPMKESTDKIDANSNLEIATLGGGCFWCTEAVYEKIEGVVDVVSGYMGGHVENPTYEQICTKTTGHAEVIQVKFDTSKITFEEVLDVFWQAHDPTTINRQGNDRGPQYRSAIFYHSPAQKNIAEKSMAALDASGTYEDPAVTEITEASKFWVAEDYHQDYYELNKDKNPYCRIVISPKMKKFGFE